MGIVSRGFKQSLSYSELGRIAPSGKEELTRIAMKRLRVRRRKDKREKN